MGAGARIHLCCKEAEISLRTYRRWVKNGEIIADKRPDAIHPKPANKLSDEEIEQILEVCHRPEYVNLPPSQIVPRLADLGVYIASESSFYRVLKQRGEQHHRGRSRERSELSHVLTTHQASAPKELWSWDVTYLPSRVKGQFFYLYMIIDVFSRKIVGYEVYEQETGVYAAKLIERTAFAEQICQTQAPLILHQDNGAPMKSYTFRAKLEDLGIISSYSRPRVSDDNPYIESLFRTVKYSQFWPSRGFESLTQARKWVKHFTSWYNHEHRHSKIGFITPHQKHCGESDKLMENRAKVYQTAKSKNPARWSGKIRAWESTQTVYLNPERKNVGEIKTVAE